MRRLEAASSLTVVLLLGGFLSSAQVTPPRASSATERGRAQDEAGLLLGIRADRSYQTLWIVFDAGGPSVAGHASTLIVPRGAGFSQIEVVTLHAGKEGKSDQDVLLAWRAGRARPVPALNSEFEETVVEACDAHEPPEEAHETIELLFAGPQYAAMHQTANDTCGAHPNAYERLAVVSLDAVEKRLTIDAVLGRAARRQLERAAGVFLRSVPKADRSGYAPVNPADWAIVRGPRSWEVQGHVGPASSYAVAASDAFATPIQPSAAVTGFVEQPATAPSDPEIKTVLAAPGRPLSVSVTAHGSLVVRTGETIAATLHDPAVSVVDAVVVAQWAFGRHVDDWSRQLRPVLTR